MAMRIEDYALIGDCHTGALVGRDGSIDWLCLPRFDSASMFGALLGTDEHGSWRLAPAHPEATVSLRTYLGNTFVLWTRWETPDGAVEVTDFMSMGDRRADVVRRVRGISGTVRMQGDLRLRFGYATALPWIRKLDGDDPRLVAVAGPDAVVVRGPELTATNHHHGVSFDVSAGETVDTTLTWYPSHRSEPPAFDVDRAIEHTTEWWESWASSIEHSGPHQAAVRRSLLVLRALTHEDTGGIVAAATTSLPEQFGGSRNWDYRYVWLRDASLTLEVLLAHGFDDEADEWRTWLLRAIAGDPGDVQIMYGLSGERYLPERDLDSLPGYQGSGPVRVGNGAFEQYQADVIGEVMLALQAARDAGVGETEFSWPLQRALIGFVEENWERQDSGIWEIRGAEQHFTHSRAMIWAALDCAVQGVEKHGLDGPVEQWRALRDRVRDEILDRGVDPATGAFRQHYGTTEVDASLLILAQAGFCAYDDPRMLATVEVMERTLMHEGFLLRYDTSAGVDGLPAGEYPFLACSFWLVEQYARSGREADGRALMERLVALSNDVGLLSEEYDPVGLRQAGNVPQALSHLALVRAADALEAAVQAHPDDLDRAHRDGGAALAHAEAARAAAPADGAR
ncbi:glycoside hydrolase family 15 protein [Clavibacter capsici]|uniref:Glycoside hydrolase family 15 protein n=1 Tax=Clavibacter capsici TaxID=1874630 RepID=A0AAE6XPZ9_9MICO|nr:glycoside hydrolase family 15 protein [Clavibacter capsici]ALD12360.1 glucoamylase [Clavibacter capsici]QIS44483.1 glycoside hydrolase family 15 protein [Clavibacter capsici]